MKGWGERLANWAEERDGEKVEPGKGKGPRGAGVEKGVNSWLQQNGGRVGFFPSGQPVLSYTCFITVSNEQRTSKTGANGA